MSTQPFTREQVLRARQEGRLSAQEAQQYLGALQPQRQRSLGERLTNNSFNPLRNPLLGASLTLATLGIGGGGLAGARGLASRIPGAARAGSAVRSATSAARAHPLRTAAGVGLGALGASQLIGALTGNDGGVTLPPIPDRPGVNTAAQSAADLAGRPGPDLGASTGQTVIDPNLIFETAFRERESALDRQASGDQARLQREQQAQSALVPLLQELLRIQSSPASRLRFAASQARAQGATEIPGMSVNNQLSALFGLEPGSAISVGGDRPLVTIPNARQLANLPVGSTEELDALTELLFGQRFSDITNQTAQASPRGTRPTATIRR